MIFSCNYNNSHTSSSDDFFFPGGLFLSWHLCLSYEFHDGKKQQFVLKQFNFDLQVTSWYFFPLKKLLIWWVKCQEKKKPIIYRTLLTSFFLILMAYWHLIFWKCSFSNRCKDLKKTHLFRYLVCWYKSFSVMPTVFVNMKEIINFIVI